MSVLIGTASGHNDLFDQLRTFLSAQGLHEPPTYIGTGNGTLSGLAMTSATVTELWTLTCTATAVDGGTFSVLGSISGIQASATVGTPYSNAFLSFTINDGTTDFIIGDEFKIIVYEKWTELEWSGAITNRLLWLMAHGLSGTEQIFMGLRSYESVPSDYYNLSVFGATGYVSGNTYLTQPGFSGAFGCPMWNQSIPFWFVANGQRAVVVAKIQTVFESFYIGKMLPLGATPNQYPYPLFIGAPLSSEAATRYSDLTHTSWHVSANSANAKFRFVDGVWKTFSFWPLLNTLITLRNTNADFNSAAGDYGLHAMTLCDTTNIYGFLDGVLYVSGFNNAAENTVQIGGVDHLVVPNIWRTGLKDYMAVRLI